MFCDEFVLSTIFAKQSTVCIKIMGYTAVSRLVYKVKDWQILINI